MGVGIAAMVVPVYLAEISPTAIRGSIVTANNLLTTFGYSSLVIITFTFTRQFFAYVICLACGNSWRAMLALAGLPSAIQFIAMFCMPESPKWLLKRGFSTEAELIMKRVLREDTTAGKNEIKYELETISKSISEEGDLSLKEMYRQLFTTYRRSLFVGVMLQVWQQLAGINTAMYYGPMILKEAGWGGESDKDNLINSLPLGAINFLGTLLAVYYTDR